MERKLATVLFVDLVDSTALVTGADPEVVRRRVQRFFERVSHCVTTHGGIVEKFAGDAVMAAFGIPQAHEDDAERAVRAGLSILDAVRELELEARVGIEAGEVVADDTDSTFATGEAVTVAARLEQVAEPGQLLIGPGAHRLSLGRVEVEDVGPVELKGLGSQIWAWRVLSASGGVAVRPQSQQAPLVGRDAELDLLQNTYDRALRDRRAHLFTIYGEPGVGKSRLSHEFSQALEGSTVLAGRSLPYGEGVTYWPLAEMVKCAAGIVDDDPLDVAIEKLREFCEDEVVADLLGLASGVLEAVQAERSQQEIAWAAREWAQRLAQEQPLVLVFEDIHWAEEPLLELIEHLVTWVREAPLLVITLARPELLDIRPGWGGGRVRATSIELEPLGHAESEELMDALDGSLDASDRAAVLAKTEGNPLFLEETVRMLSEEGAEGIGRIPDTLQALIAARIDRLAPEAKALLQRAAVIGRIFWEGALLRLSPELESLDAPLDDLRLREFVLDEERSSIRGERAYKFKHVLIREVAYAGLSKSARAEHHARFAEWLKERAGEELLEIRAFHLERATSLLTELDGSAPVELQREAAEALAEAGLRAFAREANRTARHHFVRSVELEPTLRRRYLAARAADRLSDLPAVSREMEEVLAAAIQEGDVWTQGRALVALAEAAVLREADVRAAEEMIENALQVLEPDDLTGRFRALRARATIAWMRGDLAKEEKVMLEGLELARKAGRKDFESEASDELASVYLARLQLDRAAPLIEQAILLAEESGSAETRGRALRFAGQLHLQRGELDDAEAALNAAHEHLAEAGAAWNLGRTLNFSAWTARGKGDIARAERLFRESIRILAPLEDRATLCETQRGLAELLLAQGRIDEAERFALAARETVGPHDVSSLATTTASLGLVRAAQGRDDEAEELLREANETISTTEHRHIQCNTLKALTQFLRDHGRDDEADELEARREEVLAEAATA
ncbi:MAG TPA: AAA family ATPase [Gaiellaceae bacterium]|jgi:class 3 adenylate cyclase/tetratricopeptide (TPR) repeat protein